MHGAARPLWSPAGEGGGMLPGMLCAGARMRLVGTWQQAEDKTSLKQAISSQEGRAAFPDPLSLPWQWFPRQCQLPTYIRMVERFFLFWRAGALPPVPPTSLREQGPSAPLAGTCQLCTSVLSLWRSTVMWLRGAQLAPGSHVGLHRSRTSTRAHPVPGFSGKDQGAGRWGGGLLDPSSLLVLLRKHPSPRGHQ